MRVDTLLTELLEATAAKTAASRRIDRLRDVLDAEARRRFAAEGAAPSWKAPRLGGVRLDPKPAKAYVADADAFASYVAQRFPSEVTARVELAATDLEAALSALNFAGVEVLRSAVEVRPTFADALLANADVLYDDSDPANVVKAVGRVVESTGELELVDGTDVLPPSASLVVTLDRDRKRAELDRVDAALEAELDVVAAPAPTAEQEVEAAVIGERLRSAAASIGQSFDDKLVDEAAAITASTDPAGALDDALRARAGNPGPPPGQPTGRAGMQFAPRPGDPGYSLAPPKPAVGDPDREPYVGTGADGARRSAEVDRSEVDGLDRDDPRREELLASAARWDEQADRLAGAERTHSPTIAEQQRAHAAARAAAITAHLGDPYDGAVPDSNVPPAPPADEARTEPELMPAEPVVPVDQPVEPVPGVVDELLTYTTDDLKRAARKHRIALNGTKVVLAGRLARAGVTAQAVAELRPAAE